MTVYLPPPEIISARPYLLAIDRAARGLGRYELTSFFATPNAVSSFVTDIISHFQSKIAQLDAVVGIDALGFPVAGALGDRLGVPIILARKKGKLALQAEDMVRTDAFEDYSVTREGVKGLEIRKDLLRSGMKVIVLCVSHPALSLSEKDRKRPRGIEVDGSHSLCECTGTNGLIQEHK